MNRKPYIVRKGTLKAESRKGAPNSTPWKEPLHPSSTPRSELRHIRGLVASHAAFAAVTAEGSVVSWGDPSCGGYLACFGV